MNKLIIFFSLTGKNREVAYDLAEEEKSDILEFSPGGYLRVFQYVSKRRLVKRAKKIDTRKYKELIIIGPIWGGKPAPAIMALLENVELDNKTIECHFSHTGNFGETENLVKNLISERNSSVKKINFNLISKKAT